MEENDSYETLRALNYGMRQTSCKWIGARFKSWRHDILSKGAEVPFRAELPSAPPTMRRNINIETRYHCLSSIAHIIILNDYLQHIITTTKDLFHSGTYTEALGFDLVLLRGAYSAARAVVRHSDRCQAPHRRF
jgi:hypothetical protein